MKTNAEIAHIWANDLNYSGQQSNLFYQGQTIYSYGYHFPIATHIACNTVLMTTRGYSNSTAKHIRLVLNAISHKNIIWCNNPKGSHAENIDAFLREIKNESANLVNARKPEKYLLIIEQIKNKLNKYLEHFELKLTAQQIKLISINSKGSYLELIKKEKEQQAKADKKIISLGKKLYPVYVSNFRNGTKQDFTSAEQKAIDKYYHSIGAPVIFKIKDKEIESSKGVKIPVDVAKRYIDKFYNQEIKIDDRILNFKVIKLAKDFIAVGCHNIFKNEIDYLYKNI